MRVDSLLTPAFADGGAPPHSDCRLGACYLEWRLTPSVRLPRPITSVIFDLDGVLLDTERLYTEAIAEVAARYGKVYDWPIKSQCIGRGTLEAGQTIVDALALPLSAMELVRLRDEKLVPRFADVAPIPGAVAFTRALAVRRIPMAIATSSPADIFAIKAAAHSAWFRSFAATVCGDDPRVKQGKPAPDIFLAAASSLGVRPVDCVVFEDSPFGLDGALRAGMQVVAMPDPAMDRAKYAGAAFVVSGFAEVSLRDLGL
jgi:pseudouridine 5'-phosphatase